jgi:hypothetical protein
MDKIADILPLVLLIGVVMAIVMAGIALNTWLRMKHGYPLDGAWGQAIYPRSNEDTTERVKLLSQENAALRAELGSIKDRLGNVERIVTDRGTLLAQEIDQLRDRAN